MKTKAVYMAAIHQLLGVKPADDEAIGDNQTGNEEHISECSFAASVIRKLYPDHD